MLSPESVSSESSTDELIRLRREIAYWESQLNQARDKLSPDDDDDFDYCEDPTPEQIRLNAEIQEELSLHTKVAVDRIGITTAIYKRADSYKLLQQLKEQNPPNYAKIQKVEGKMDNIEHLENLNRTFIETAFNNTEHEAHRFENVSSLPDAKLVLHSVFKRTLDLQHDAVEAEEKIKQLEKKIREKEAATASIKQKISNRRERYVAKKAAKKEEYNLKTLRMLQRMRGVPPRCVDEATKLHCEAQDAKIGELTEKINALSTENIVLEATVEVKKRKQEKKAIRKAKRKAMRKAVRKARRDVQAGTSRVTDSSV